MPTNVFRGDYEQLAKIAQRFACEQDAAQQMIDTLQHHTNVLQGGDWVGDGANAFYAEMNNDVLPSLKRLAQALKSAQTKTAQISREIKRAEDEAAAVLRDTGAQIGEGSSGGRLNSPAKVAQSQGGFPPPPNNDEDDPFRLKDPCNSANPLVRWMFCSHPPAQPHIPTISLPNIFPGIVIANGQPIVDFDKLKQIFGTRNHALNPPISKDPPSGGGDSGAIMKLFAVLTGLGLIGLAAKLFGLFGPQGEGAPKPRKAQSPSGQTSSPAPPDPNDPHYKELLKDKDRGDNPNDKTKPRQADSAWRTEQEYDVKLKPSGDNQAGDFVDQRGKVYDMVGNRDPAYVMQGKMTVDDIFTSVVNHLTKTGIDYTVIDMNGLTPTEVDNLYSLLNNLSKTQLDKIIVVGVP